METKIVLILVFIGVLSITNNASSTSASSSSSTFAHVHELTSAEILAGFSIPKEETAEFTIDYRLKMANKGGGEGDEIKKKRTMSRSGNGLFDKKWRWTKNVIPYKFSSDYDDVDVSMVYSAMKEWMDKTCIRFEPYGDQLAKELGHNNFIEFRNTEGCTSYVGMQGSGAQKISLQIPNCMYHETSLHELGHAIGLHHEQCRSDRDQYIHINWHNIEPDLKSAFQRVSDTTNYSIPYDYCSIMHYGAWSFTMGKDGAAGSGITVVPKDISYFLTMGKSMHLAFSDEKIVNIMFSCAKDAPESAKAACQKPCFLNHKHECRCPDNKCAERKAECKDYYLPTYLPTYQCPFWANNGDCSSNPLWMNENCPKSCGICDEMLDAISKGKPTGRCNDYHNNCAMWKSWGECENNPEYMLSVCTKSCGLCEGECKDEHVGVGIIKENEKDCESWALADECEVNPTVMFKICKKSCKLCGV